MHVISNGAKYIDLKRLKQQNHTEMNLKAARELNNRATDGHFPLL